MDKLGKKLVSIENKLGGSEPVPSNVQDKLGWHLDYIESLIGGGGGGGSTSAPVFDAEITEESGKIVVSMSEEDKNDIYSHKYPVIGIHIVDEEENDIVLYFKIRIGAAEANAIVYDNWDGGDGDISQMELTFVWDGDDTKVTFEANDFSGGSDLEYATNNDIDALFEEPVVYATFEVGTLTNCSLSGISDGDQIAVGQSLTFTVTGTENNMVGGSISNNGVEYTIQEMGDLITNQGENWFEFTIPVVNGNIVVSFEFQGDEPEDIPIQSLRYTDGSGNTCIGFNMLVGESVDLVTNLEITPSDATDGVEFISDDDGIVMVDSGGIATATGVSGDSTMITISSMENPNIYTTVEISINEAEPEEEEK